MEYCFKVPKKERLNKWKNYVRAPWEIINDNKPDLIFIDGRFRVACALYSIIQMKDYPGNKILIDDYSYRPEYKIIEKYANFEGIKGRLGIFKVPIKIDKSIFKTLDKYYSKWS